MLEATTYTRIYGQQQLGISAYEDIFTMKKVNYGNSFSRCGATALERRRSQSEDSEFAHFSDLAVWYFSDALWRI